MMTDISSQPEIDLSTLEGFARLITDAAEWDASDIHLKTSIPPVFRINGEFTYKDGYRLNVQENTLAKVVEFTTNSKTAQARVDAMEDLDYSYTATIQKSNGRSVRQKLRINFIICSDGYRAVIRLISQKIPTLKAVGLDADSRLIEIFESTRVGLILITGATGSGKTTTTAALLRHVSEMPMSAHVLTLEDPIEYDLTALDNEKTIFTQRELKVSLKSFRSGMSSAMREDIDYIYVGELRDLDTVKTAIEMAQTGHCVIATLHTADVASTVDRITAMFPESEARSLKTQLLNALKVVISQTLLIRSDGTGRVAAREILYFDSGIKSSIANTKNVAIAIDDAITSREKGLARSSFFYAVSMKSSILRLKSESIIDDATAKTLLKELLMSKETIANE